MINLPGFFCALAIFTESMVESAGITERETTLVATRYIGAGLAEFDEAGGRIAVKLGELLAPSFVRFLAADEVERCAGAA